MVDAHASPTAERFEVRVTADSHFAWLRTRMSLERTLMSWVRTAVALIGFGFTIVQFFERMRQLPAENSVHFPQAPYYLGLALIACGIWLLSYRFGSTGGHCVTCGAGVSPRLQG